jgi:hypothetical protein
MASGISFAALGSGVEDLGLHLRSSMKTPAKVSIYQRFHQQQQGALGYILLWAMGVPASLLFVIFLLRGCD